MPQLGLRHRNGAGATRFEVGLDGSVRLVFRPARLSRALVYGGYDAGTSLYRLSYRVAF